LSLEEIEVCNNSKKLYGEMDGFYYSYRYPYKIKFVSEGARFNVKCTYYDEDHKFKVEVDRVFVILPTEEYLTDHLNKNSGLNMWENKEDKITITQTITNKQTVINAEIISSTSYYGTYTKATGILDMHVVYTITTKYGGQVKNEEKDEYRIKYNKNTDEYYFNEELSTTPTNENTIIGKTILAIKGFEQLVK
jgi:hypothetical protein